MASPPLADTGDPLVLATLELDGRCLVLVPLEYRRLLAAERGRRATRNDDGSLRADRLEILARARAAKVARRQTPAADRPPAPG